MLLKKVMSFLSLQHNFGGSADDLRDIRPYQIGDTRHTINWKKTASFNQLMTNVYEPDIHTHGKIIEVESPNWQKGYLTPTHTLVKEFITSLQKHLASDPQSTLHIITTKEIPGNKFFGNEKTLVISDFFWDDEALQKFIHRCQKEEARGIVIPMVSQTGPYHHPLIKKHPTYFRELPLQ